MPKCGCEKNNCSAPAVLQINNKETPVLFHKVLFPAVMGDDETNPPFNGQFYNVLLQYEANKHIYMFSSDGIPTFISSGYEDQDTTDYNLLDNKPLINSVVLIGDKSFRDLGADRVTNSDIDNIVNVV